jgi:hypothetical protein
MTFINVNLESQTSAIDTHDPYNDTFVDTCTQQPGEWPSMYAKVKFR